MKQNQDDSVQSRGERLVYERVSRDLWESYQKPGEKNKHTCGGIFRTSVVFFYLLAVYDFLVLVVNVFVNLLAIGQYSSQDNADKSAFFRSNSAILVLMLVCLAASFVFMALRRRKTACVLSFVNLALLGLQFSQIAVGGFPDDKKLTMILFYIPVALLLIFCLIIFVITLRDERDRKRAYDRELSKIYRRYSSEENGLMSGDKWNEIIAEYEQDREKRNLKKRR